LALAAGCTGGDGQGETSPDGESGSPAASNEAAAVSEDAVRWARITTDTPPGMPLEPYFAALRHERDVLGPATEAAQARRHDDMEAYIAQCMADQGFKYHPQARGGPAGAPDQLETMAAESDSLRDPMWVPQLPETREQTERHGYGLWVEYATLVNEGAEARGEDPNQAYYDGMSQSEKEAYDLALDNLIAVDAETWVPATDDGIDGSDSCRDRAAREYPDPGLEKPLTDYVNQDLVYGVMADVTWSVDKDPRTLELDREWAVCMAGFGHDVAEKWGVGDGGGVGYTSGPILAWHLARATGPDGQIADTENLWPDQIPEDQQSLIGSEPEIAIALADFDCREQTDYMSRRIAIHRDLEEQVLADNREALDDLLAQIEANIQANS
jgi:hypothetical protein